MINWWIGCSGFHYKDWKEVFYPSNIPQTKWFEYYCTHFNTIELNVTFYRFPRPEALLKWHDRSPEKFKFSVKAPRLITHYKMFKESERIKGQKTHPFFEPSTYHSHLALSKIWIPTCGSEGLTFRNC